MIIQISERHRVHRLAGSGTLGELMEGSDNAYIELYDDIPAEITDSITGATLVRVYLADTPGVLNGSNELVLQQESGDDPMVLVSGTVAGGRVFSGDGSPCIQGDASNLAGTGFFKLPELTIFAGGLTSLVTGKLR